MAGKKHVCACPNDEHGIATDPGVSDLRCDEYHTRLVVLEAQVAELRDLLERRFGLTFTAGDEMHGTP